MRRTVVGFAILGLALSGCTEDETQQSAVEAQAQANSGSADLYYAYPTQGQASTPTSASVFLRFGERLDASAEEIADSSAVILREQGDDGGSIDVTNVQLLDDGRGLRAEPASELTPGRSYELSISGLSVDGELINESIEFSTAASDSGPIIERTDLTGSTSEFSVARILPYADDAGTAVGNGTDEFPVTDLSTFRIQFNEPVDENTLEYGDTVRLTDSEGNLVAAEMFARDHRLTVDPSDNLDAGETYELSLGNSIQSQIGGAGLTTPDEPWSFTPESTTSPNGERSVMAQTASTDAGKLALTGQDYNSVRLSATTLGDADQNQTVQTGTVFAEMAYIPRFDRAGKSVPLRIDQGTLMEGSSVEVKVGGEVPSGFSSETIDVRFLSDANGYLMPNPYTSDPNAPRLVRLFLDLGMNTDEPRANGALAQELLHVELVGTAMVENGTLTLKAVSVIEPDVLGIDKASGLISFRLEDNPDAPAESSFADTTAPSLKSWAPGQEHQDKLQPQDSISLFFNEPLRPSTVNKETVWLEEQGGSRLDADQYQVRQNGANVIVEPKAPLSYGQAYQVGLDVDALTDLAGNKLGGVGQALSFTLPETNQEVPSDIGPVALTTRPGYPCAKADLTENTFDESEGNGRCLGGMTAEGGDQTSDWITRPEDDDLLPIEEHGSNDPIIVRFSQNMTESTMTKETKESAGNIHVEKFDDSEGWNTVESYSVETSKRSLTLVPDEGWDVGGVYRYTLKDGITSEADNPLYTKLLAQFNGDDGNGTDGRDRSDFVSGGHSLVNRFQVVESDKDVLTPLSNLPTNDVNSDYAIESPESRVPTDESGDTSAVANSGKVLYEDGSLESDLVEDANIGCQAQGDTDDSNWQDCPRNKFIYKTAVLDVELKEAIEKEGEVRVKLDPSLLLTNPLKVHVHIPALSLLLQDPHQMINTGPQVMRMRYEKNSDGERTEKISGVITRDGQGQLIFKTELDVYFDAPYMAPDIPSTNLDHNMRSFRIDDLKLEGDITFFEDGRMQIEQRNTEKVVLEDVAVKGDALGGLLDPNTVMNLFIPEGELYLNYISPYTQKEE